MFRNVIISDDILADPKLQSAVETATQLFGQTVGHSASLLDLRWDKGLDDRGRPIIRLTLKDWTGEVKAVFSPSDLAADAVLARFYKLYGDLLQIRSHKQLEHLLAGVPAGQNT
jgi:hypothetical protein